MQSAITETTLYSVAIGLSVCTLTFYFYAIYAEYKERPKDVTHFFDQTTQQDSPFLNLLKPPASFFGHFIALFAQRLEARLGKDGITQYINALRFKVQRALSAAGNPGGFTADDYLGLFVVSILSIGGFGVLLAIASSSGLVLFFALLISAAYPVFWLRKIISQRQTEIRNLMPYALDLLTLSVEAGLDFSTALVRITPKLGSTALANEFGEVVRQMRLGRPRAETLREMANRVNMSDINTFCSSLIQADELGADLGPVLRILAEQMRNERANRAEKKAMEAPVKILFPLIFFIFPTVFIILFAPLGIQYLEKLFAG